MCCSPWGHKESDTTEPLNNKTESGRKVENINRSVISNETELGGWGGNTPKSSQQTKVQDHTASQVNSSKTCGEELTSRFNIHTLINVFNKSRDKDHISLSMAVEKAGLLIKHLIF